MGGNLLSDCGCGMAGAVQRTFVLWHLGQILGSRTWGLYFMFLIYIIYLQKSRKKCIFFVLITHCGSSH